MGTSLTTFYSIPQLPITCNNYITIAPSHLIYCVDFKNKTFVSRLLKEDDHNCQNASRQIPYLWIVPSPMTHSRHSLKFILPWQTMACFPPPKQYDLKPRRVVDLPECKASRRHPKTWSLWTVATGMRLSYSGMQACRLKSISALHKSLQMKWAQPFSDAPSGICLTLIWKNCSHYATARINFKRNEK